MSLAQHSCRGRCDWKQTERTHRDQPVFECTGCGSEWAPTQKWTPVNADGVMSQEVVAARDACPG